MPFSGWETEGPSSIGSSSGADEAAMYGHLRLLPPLGAEPPSIPAAQASTPDPPPLEPAPASAPGSPALAAQRLLGAAATAANRRLSGRKAGAGGGGAGCLLARVGGGTASAVGGRGLEPLLG